MYQKVRKQEDTKEERQRNIFQREINKLEKMKKKNEIKE